MSKKDYQAIAAAIHGEIKWRGKDHVTAQDLIDRLARVFGDDNPRFDRARFLEACETGTCKGMRK